MWCCSCGNVNDSETKKQNRYYEDNDDDNDSNSVKWQPWYMRTPTPEMMINRNTEMILINNNYTNPIDIKIIIIILN